ncbi:hypothetical protein PMIN01_04368 [Paraphaeosphaeria minitans]|uniref:Uncharacterized protein n=1 Tax=Paraphaeosphaeria minitans TaxID=565426 RepID=A0A9P6GJJ7_9PLEO|nr:hypothetical protein PMIN01_04368 [Paraphaeosphaeria minitans]
MSSKPSSPSHIVTSAMSTPVALTATGPGNRIGRLAAFANDTLRDIKDRLMSLTLHPIYWFWQCFGPGKSRRKGFKVLYNWETLEDESYSSAMDIDIRVSIQPKACGVVTYDSRTLAAICTRRMGV